MRTYLAITPEDGRIRNSIREWREERGLTQVELGRRISVDKVRMHLIESGQRAATSRELDALAEEFGRPWHTFYPLVQLSLAEAGPAAGNGGGLVAARPATQASVQDRYNAWRGSDNAQRVMVDIAARALALRRRGWERYGIAALFEAARYDRDLQLGPSEDQFRLNNTFRSRLAREIMAAYPELRGFFATRKLAG